MGRIVTDLFNETGYFGILQQFSTLQNVAIAAKRVAFIEAGWSEVVVLIVGERFHKETMRRCPRKMMPGFK